MDFAIVDRHCILRKGADNALTLVGGDGETYHNGAKVENGAEIALSVGDRIVMASVMTMLYIPGNELAEMKTTEEIAQEYQKARMSSKDSGEMKALQAQKDAWEKQKAEMEAQMEALRLSQAEGASAADKEKARAQEAAMKKQLAEEEAKQVEARNRSIMLDLIPKVDEAGRMLKLLNRGMMQCEAMLRVGKFHFFYYLQKNPTFDDRSLYIQYTCSTTVLTICINNIKSLLSLSPLLLFFFCSFVLSFFCSFVLSSLLYRFGGRQLLPNTRSQSQSGECDFRRCDLFRSI